MNVYYAWTYAICCVYDIMFMGKIVFIVANYTYNYYIHFFEFLSIWILLKFELQFCIYLYSNSFKIHAFSVKLKSTQWGLVSVTQSCKCT